MRQAHLTRPRNRSAAIGEPVYRYDGGAERTLGHQPDVRAEKTGDRVHRGAFPRLRRRSSRQHPRHSPRHHRFAGARRSTSNKLVHPPRQFRWLAAPAAARTTSLKSATDAIDRWEWGQSAERAVPGSRTASTACARHDTGRSPCSIYGCFVSVGCRQQHEPRPIGARPRRNRRHSRVGWMLPSSETSPTSVSLRVSGATTPAPRGCRGNRRVEGSTSFPHQTAGARFTVMRCGGNSKPLCS